MSDVCDYCSSLNLIQKCWLVARTSRKSHKGKAGHGETFSIYLMHLWFHYFSSWKENPGPYTGCTGTLGVGKLFNSLMSASVLSFAMISRAGAAGALPMTDPMPFAPTGDVYSYFRRRRTRPQLSCPPSMRQVKMGLAKWWRKESMMNQNRKYCVRSPRNNANFLFAATFSQPRGSIELERYAVLFVVTSYTPWMSCWLDVWSHHIPIPIQMQPSEAFPGYNSWKVPRYLSPPYQPSKERHFLYLGPFFLLTVDDETFTVEMLFLYLRITTFTFSTTLTHYELSFKPCGQPWRLTTPKFEDPLWQFLREISHISATPKKANIPGENPYIRKDVINWRKLSQVWKKELFPALSVSHSTFVWLEPRPYLTFLIRNLWWKEKSYWEGINSLHLSFSCTHEEKNLSSELWIRQCIDGPQQRTVIELLKADDGRSGARSKADRWESLVDTNVTGAELSFCLHPLINDCNLWRHQGVYEGLAQKGLHGLFFASKNETSRVHYKFVWVTDFR